MDLIAKAQFLNMVQHNGNFGCSKCKIKEKKGYCHTYPFTEAIVALTRNDIDVTNDALKASQSKKSVCIFVYQLGLYLEKKFKDN